MPTQYGLKWEDSLGELEPRWSEEPKLEHIEQLSRRHLNLDEAASCIVKFHAQGGFNKLYTVDTDTGKWLMRVALPVDPYRKTASEVSTMRWVQKNTSIPIPTVLAHEATNNNDLQFEWILMEYMPGTVLERSWRKMSLSAKEDLAKKLAKFQSELFSDKLRFQSIGNLFEETAESYRIGSIVSMTFFWGDRGAREDILRGPFPNSYEWLSARLNLVLEDQDKVLSNTDDEDEIEDAEAAKVLAERLLALLPGVFNQYETESTILFHDDLHEKNILVDDSGTMTAVLDWECVSFFPLWMACQLPALLNGATRNEEPQRETYAAHDPEVEEEDAEYNEGVSSLYWTHLLAYERGKLRSLFLSEMERLQPAWLTEYRDGELKRDFELAILHCNGEMTTRRVGEWLDAYEKGETCSLRQSLNA